MQEKEKTRPSGDGGTDTMKLRQIATLMAGILTATLTSCAAPDGVTSEFGKISSREIGHSTDTTRSGEIGGVGFGRSW